MALTLEVINALVPEHTVLRYKDAVTCTDSDRHGGLRYAFADKEWRCKRCVLLDLLDGFKRNESDAVAVGNPTVVLEVYDGGPSIR